MAQVTFTLPVDMPKVTAPAAAPQPQGFHFSWDMFFTILLLCIVCCCGGLMFNYFMNATQQTNPNQCTPDGQPSTGTYGSDCCSTNGIDSNGNCLPKSPIGVPPYGMTNSSTPAQYGFSPMAAPTPAPQGSPPIPYVSSPSPAPLQTS